MAVAFDAFSNVAAGTGDLSWTHTPVGTPRGVKVDIIENGGTNGVSSVTYGGVAMELVAVNAKTSGEAGTVITYFLGKSIPTGAQTVSIIVSDAVAKRAGAVTVTATTDTCWISADISIGSDSIVNPSSTLALLGKTCFVSLAGHSGQGAVTGITQITGWTNRLEHDFGAQVGGWYTYNTISTADVACGWTQTADDAVMVALAITEAPLCSDTTPIVITESASVAVVFDSRALPIIITESASVTILTAVAASDACTIRLDDVSSVTNISLAVSDSLQAVLSETGQSIQFSLYSIDTTEVQLGIESVSKTESGSTARQALPINITDTASVTAIYQNASDSASMHVSESSSVSSSTPSFIVSDSVSLTISESSVVPFPYTVDTNSISLTESRPVITAEGGELVLIITDSIAVAVSESIADLFVFIPGSLQNFVVSDSLKVQLNAGGVVPTEKTTSDSLSIGLLEPDAQQSFYGVSDSITVQSEDVSAITAGLSSVFTVLDSVAVVVGDASSVTANTILTASDSLRVQTVEDVPEVVTAVTASDSLRTIVLEPSDQYTQLGTLDALAITISGEVLGIGGLLTFLVSDALAIGTIEISSFGITQVKTTDTNSVALSEVLSNSASVVSAENISAAVIESYFLNKNISIFESLAVQSIDTASPIFNSFVDIQANDSCTIQAAESITELVNFLSQLSATDGLSIQIDEAFSTQLVTASASDIAQFQSSESSVNLLNLSVADLCSIGTIEAGLAIPIVSVNVSTFAGDAILGFSDQAALSSQNIVGLDSNAVQGDESIIVSVAQPTAESVASFIIESLRIDLSASLIESNALGITESASIAITQSVDDATILTALDDKLLQPGFYFDDTALVVCSEHTDGYAIVANATPATWDGGTSVEHRKTKPYPSKYRMSSILDW